VGLAWERDALRGADIDVVPSAVDGGGAGKTVAEVARLLEVSDQSIYMWRRQELIDRGELPGLSFEEREELRAARVRIRELETELAVHRRAAELLNESVRPEGGSRRSR
jgi:transposase-like protein